MQPATQVGRAEERPSPGRNRKCRETASTSQRGRRYRTRASYSRDVRQGLTRRRARKPTSRAGVSRSRVRPGGWGFAHSCGPWWALAVCAAPAPPVAPGPEPANSASWSSVLIELAPAPGAAPTVSRGQAHGRWDPWKAVPRGLAWVSTCFLSPWICLFWTSHVNRTPQYMVSVTGFFHLGSCFQGHWNCGPFDCPVMSLVHMLHVLFTRYRGWTVGPLPPRNCGAGDARAQGPCGPVSSFLSGATAGLQAALYPTS